MARFGYNECQHYPSPQGMMGKSARTTMIPLSYLAIHSVRGADAGSFLHAQLAADIASLDNGQASFAAYCSPRGQVIALLLVCRQDPDWFIVNHARLAEAVASRLKMFILRADAQIEARPDLLVAGLCAGASKPDRESAFSPGGLSLHYALRPSASQEKVPSSPWRREEILRAVSWLQPETSDRFLPQMLGLQAIQAVSFSKGCYPGQEVIARTRYLGKLKRGPLLLEIDGQVSLAVGEGCVLDSGDQSIEAVIVDIVQENPSTTLLRAVAPLEHRQMLHTLRGGGRSWAVQRTLQEGMEEQPAR
jgi:folate-binding protein YgfZ